MAEEGKILIQSDIIPNNENPRMFVTDAKYVKGAPQVFDNVDELVGFHPDKMKRGMTASLINWPGPGVTTRFTLNTEPANLKDASNNSIVTSTNFTQFWEIETQNTISYSRVRQYAPDSPGGGAPVYPYTLLEESNWSNVFDAAQGHKWMRFRDDDVDDNSDGIFDNWSIPISISNAFQTGDYVDKRFKREGVVATFDVVHSGTGTLTEDSYYLVDTNFVEITGDLSLNDIGEQGSNTTIVLSTGKVFKYKSANTYNFAYNGAATVKRIVKTPPRTLSGAANNEPAGWSDAPPLGTDQLWEISGQKSVYGQLKSDWILKRVVENPQYTRYSDSSSPHPDTIVDGNTSAADATPGDVALEAAGWSKSYSGQAFIAKRSANGSPPPTYTPWLVEKITEESGEYVDRVFKLFDINIEAADLEAATPTDRDPSREGWTDTPQTESETQINYVSEARKYFDGTLKTSWSTPVPYTGKDVYVDTIQSIGGNSFKYDSLGAYAPASIVLQANLYKGDVKLWEQQGFAITYEWKKVYDGGIVVDIAPTNSPADDFYHTPITGSGQADAGGTSAIINDAAGLFITKGVSIGDKIWNVTDGSYATVLTLTSETSLVTSDLVGGFDNTWASGDIYFLEVDKYAQLNQRVTIKPGAVDGLAVFRCKQTIAMSQGPDMVFEEEFTVQDVADGKDSKSLAITSDAQRFLYDTGNKVFSPLGLVLRAYHSNLGSPTYYWYEWNGSSWSALTNGVDGYSISGNLLTCQVGVYETAGAFVIGESYTIRETGTTDYTLIGAANSTPGTVFTATGVGTGTGTAWRDSQCRFVADTSAEEIRYAVSTHASNPDSADFITTFSDYITISKLSASNVGVNGENAVLAVLSNESHVVVLDSGTGVPATGEVAKAYTRVSVFDGLTQLNYNGVEFSVALGAGESTYFDLIEDPDDSMSARVALKNGTWVDGVLGYVANLTITYGAVTITKKFTLASSSDAPGAILLDIESDKGFEFTPQDKTDKTLTAKLYDSSLTGDQLIALPDAAYQFRWNVGNSWGTLSSANTTKVVTRANIITSPKVILEVYINGGATLYRSLTISLSDVVDGRAYRAWTTSNPPGTDLLTNQDPTSAFGGGTVVVGAVTWRLQSNSYWNSNQPMYAQDAYVDPVSGNWVWTPAYRIKGEQGVQGGSGNFFMPMYKSTERIIATETTIADFASASGGYVFNKGAVILLNNSGAVPYYYNGGTKTLVGSYSTTQVAPDYGAGGNTSTIAQMVTAGWVAAANMPSSGVLWKTECLWDGDGVTFDINGLPSTLAVPGATWSVRSKISGVDGRSYPAVNGLNGWSPVFAIVSDGARRVVQLTDWIGGTGTKPGNINDYVAPSGFTSNIALATDIRGPQGADASVWSGVVYSVNGSNGSPDYESWHFKFRLTSNGIVHYSIRTHRGGSGIRHLDFSLPSQFAPSGPELLAGVNGSGGIYTDLPTGFYQGSGNAGIAPDRHHRLYYNGSSWKLRLCFFVGQVAIAQGSYPTQNAFS